MILSQLRGIIVSEVLILYMETKPDGKYAVGLFCVLKQQIAQKYFIFERMNFMYLPHVLEQTANGERGMDLYSRLLNDRIIFLSEEVNNATASIIVAQMLYLEAQDPKADISFYINSPGGSISAGMAIYDTMQHIKCDVSTIGVGLQASMGAFLLSSGTKGKRYILPNAEVMIHQPLSGTQGQASDIIIAAEHIQRLKQRLNKILAEQTGKSIEQIAIDTDRDNWLTAEEALEYGLVDKIL